MRELPFPYVTVTNHFGKAKNITSVAEASVWLVAHWPIRNSEKLQAAKLTSLDALWEGHLHGLSKLIYGSRQRSRYLRHSQAALAPITALTETLRVTERSHGLVNIKRIPGSPSWAAGTKPRHRSS
jgi:hypothetical protein